MKHQRGKKTKGLHHLVISGTSTVCVCVYLHPYVQMCTAFSMRLSRFIHKLLGHVHSCLVSLTAVAFDGVAA